MPFVKPKPDLGDSYQHALKRFEAQKGRLQHNSDLRDQYKAFIHEFFDLKHLEKVSENETDNGCQNHF